MPQVWALTPPLALLGARGSGILGPVGALIAFNAGLWLLAYLTGRRVRRRAPAVPPAPPIDLAAERRRRRESG